MTATVITEIWNGIAVAAGTILSWDLLIDITLRSEFAKTLIFNTACKTIMRLEDSTAMIVVRGVILEQHGDMAKSAMRVSYVRLGRAWGRDGMLCAAKAAIENEQKLHEEERKSN